MVDRASTQKLNGLEAWKINVCLTITLFYDVILVESHLDKSLKTRCFLLKIILIQHLSTTKVKVEYFNIHLEMNITSHNSFKYEDFDLRKYIQVKLV